MSNQDVFDQDVLQRLYRYACALCKNQDQAYDLLQYALEKYITNRGELKCSHGVAYVRTTLRNRFVDEYRRSKRFVEENYDDASPIAMDETSLENITISQLDLEIIWKRLDPFEREILYYWAIEEMTAKEIAQAIDVARGTVLSRMHRMRKRIEAEIESGQLAGGYTS